MKLKIANKSKAVQEWMTKEEGSFEDHNGSPDHVVAILERGVITTRKEAETVLKSADYQQSWEDDEIVGGAITKRTIKRIAEKIEVWLKNASQ